VVLDARLAPLVADPSRAAVLTDFDGTLAPIVSDPSTAHPLPGVTEVLAALARRFRSVAVVSGRPVSYLLDRLGPLEGVHVAGLYGLERADGTGPVVVEPAAAEWRNVVADVLGRLRSSLPAEADVEEKGLTLTVHWRRAPSLEGVVRAGVDAEAVASGLAVHDGRMSVELRPPLPVDKGSVTEELVGECSSACFLGDDVGDLPAFAALDRRAKDGVHTLKVAVVDAESAPEVAAAADLVVEGPRGALALLTDLLEASLGSP
jgi:trehalose 6-phosphate phosphatase